MPADAGYFLALLLLSSLLNPLAHVLRARITLGPLYALAGIQVLLLWHIRGLGWWVEWGPLGIAAGLVSLLPALLSGVLLTHALDGIRAARAYLLVALLAGLLGWGFAALRQEVAEHVPIPFAFELAPASHLGVLLGLAAGALAAVLGYELARRVVTPLALPAALYLGLLGYLVPSSLAEYGRVVGWANVAEQLPEFALFALPSALLLLAYGHYARGRRDLMPSRRLGDVLRFWRRAETSLEETRREFLEARRTITELRQLNEALEESRRANDLQVAESPFAVLYVQPGGQVSYANAAALRMLPSPDASGRRVEDWLGDGHSPDLDALAASRLSPVLRVRRGAGDAWLELTAMQRYGADGQAVGHQLFIKDVTARRRAQRVRVIEERVKGIHQTGRVLVHDFTSLLLGMQGTLGELERAFQERAGPAFAEALATLRQGIRHGRELLRQLGAGEAFARPRLARVDVASLLREAARICRPAAREKGVEIVEQALPALEVRADAAQMTRVLTNLVSNAVRAAPPGGRIELSAAGDGGGAVAEVADDGPGLPPEARERAFEPGFSSKGGGTGGLGLAIAYLLVEAHGGRLSLEPNTPRGLRARVWLPRAEEGDLDAVARARLVVFLRERALAGAVLERLDALGAGQVAEVAGEEELAAVAAEEGCDLVIADDGLAGVVSGACPGAALLELDAAAGLCRVRAPGRFAPGEMEALARELGWRLAA